jgi:hypothetical protein
MNVTCGECLQEHQLTGREKNSCSCNTCTDGNNNGLGSGGNSGNAEMITEIKSIITTKLLEQLNDKKNDILKPAWELKENTFNAYYTILHS